MIILINKDGTYKAVHGIRDLQIPLRYEIIDSRYVISGIHYDGDDIDIPTLNNKLSQICLDYDSFIKYLKELLKNQLG